MVLRRSWNPVMPELPPSHIVRDALLYLILPAFLLAAMTLGLIAWFGGEKQAPGGAALGFLAAVIGGPTLGHWFYDLIRFAREGSEAKDLFEFWFSLTLAPMPPSSAWSRLPWAALAALCVGRLTREAPAADAWLVRGATAFALAWWIVPEHTLEAIAWWIVPALAAAMLLNWMLLDYLASKPIDGSVALGVFACFFAASVVLLHASIARLSEPAVVIASAFAGLAVVAFWRGIDTSGAMPAAAVVLPVLSLTGQQESVVEAVPMGAYVLTALAPLALVFALPFTHWPTVWLMAWRFVLVAIPLSGAIALAMQAGPLQFE
jgi:hypothetical protein